MRLVSAGVEVFDDHFSRAESVRGDAVDRQVVEVAVEQQQRRSEPGEPLDQFKWNAPSMIAASTRFCVSRERGRASSWVKSLPHSSRS